MTPSPHDRPPTGVDHEVSQDFDDIARVTDAVKRWGIAAACVLPLWLLLLAVLGRGIGVGVGSLTIATLVAAGAAWWGMRRFGPTPRRAAHATGIRLGIPPWAFVVVGVIIALYLMLVLRARG